MSAPLVYEVTLDVGADAAADFDAWLASHVQAMLALPGFQDARILSPEAADAAPGTVRRVVQYTLAGRAELDRYLTEHAPRMRAEGTRRFGDRLKSSRRVLDVAGSAAAPRALPGLALPPEGPRCRNCGTPLTAKFCMECGQKNHTYVAPLWNVLHDFAGTHFGFDTKFFHSLMPLLFRPGYLTREYCLGHEERYIKPFRLYLFSSILFFFLAALIWNPKLEDLGKGQVNGKPVAAMSKADRDAARASIEKSLAELAKEPDSPGRDFSQDILRDQLKDLEAPPAATGAAAKPAKPSEDDFIKVNDSDLKSDAKGSDNRFVNALLQIKNHQAEFKHRLYQNIPKMMFVLMPLIALFLKLYYLGSGRFLTEHFVFTLHYHAMVFVVLLFVMLLSAGAKTLPWLAPLKDEAGTVAGWYMVIYLFLAMRFFYGQSWLKTALKFFLLCISYFIAAAITMVAGVLLTGAEIANSGV